MKFLQFSFIGAFITLAIYLFLNDIYNLNEKFKPTDEIDWWSPFPIGVNKIDVGQGDDIWILTLYRWCTIRRAPISMKGEVFDFSVASDGSVAITDIGNSLYIRNGNLWNRIGNEDYKYKNVSVCDRNVIFVVGGGPYGNIYKAVYDESKNKYDFSIFVYRYGLVSQQISCASHDKSFWFVPKWSQDYDYDYRAYLIIDKYRSIARSEAEFSLIKAVSEQHAIGIDFNHTLWEYTKGTWNFIRNNVKIASINYDGDIFYVDNKNFIYKIKRQ